MNYAALVKQILSECPAEFSLGSLLWRIDAYNKSVPSLGELNAALEACGRPSVDEAAYRTARAENREEMIRILEKRGISREQIDAAIDSHSKVPRSLE